MGRVILHSDLNCFYASAEINENPALRGKKVAVCGSTENRHGIVLTASYPAKRSGVKTGMANWEAKQACPDLIVVPPHYDLYLKYSRLVRRIYRRYCNDIEPFGMDENWLAIEGVHNVETDGLEIAEEIRQAVKDEIGLTVSIGVSFNKIFAKLGSDMKKPDAVTVISEANYRDKVWPLPVSELLYVGPATTRKLRMLSVNTIGDLANCEPGIIRSKLGKNGLMLWTFANGWDYSPVMPSEYTPPIKSVGHGTTCVRDLDTDYEVWQVMYELAQDVGHRLRDYGLTAKGVQITVRDKDLGWRQYQHPLHYPTQSPLEIAQAGYALFRQMYRWDKPVRALTVRGINMAGAHDPVQVDMFNDYLARERRRALDDAIDEIRRRWGYTAMRKRFAEGKPIIPYGAFLGYRKGPDGMPEIDPEQAETVRYIYRAFLEGKAPSYIARDLTARGILTPGGKTTWRANTVMSILTNEKYKGDALLQKTFCTDFLTKAYKVNEGEVPQYYVEHSHPAIIDRAMFDAVQIEMKKRAEPGQRTYTPYTLSGKIYCAECGARYGSKMRRGKQSWRCNNRHLGRTNCTAPVLHTETIEDAFVTAFNQVIERKDEIIRICMDTMTTRCDVSGIDARLATLNAELDVVAELIAQNIATNASVALDQDENRQKFEELMARHDSIQNEIHELERQRAELIAKLNGIRHYIGVIQDEGRITGFDETLWLNTVDRLWIKPDGTMRFEFKGGPAIEG